MRMGLGLFVGVWIARYLGPGQFGQLNYATAFVSLFGLVAALGLNGIVVRDIVRNPDDACTTLGTAFVLQLIGAVIAIALIIGTIVWLRPEDTVTKAMVAILAFALIFKTSDVVRYWFESQVESKYAVYVGSGIFVLICGFKVALILNHAPLIAFAWIVLVEAVLVAIGLFWIYLKRETGKARWRVRLTRAKALLKDSWPMIFMSLMLGVYTKIDIFMVEYFLGWDATGVYSAALTVAESWYFIAVALTSSIYPYLIEAHADQENNYAGKLAAFYSLMFWVPVIVSAILSAVSGDLLMFLYGDKYAGVASVFALYIWSSIFVFVITASSRWFLVENSTKSLMYRATFGAIANIVLNYFLLEAMGLIGAAVATLISYFLVAYVYDLFDRKAHGQVWIKLTAPLFPVLWISNARNSKKT